RPTAPPALAAAPAEAVIDGVLARYLATPYGEANGLRLDNGVVVLLPPHLATRLTAFAAIGARLRVMGRMAADGVLRASALFNLDSGASLAGGPGAKPRPIGGPAGAALRGALQSYTVAGVIELVLHGPRGEANGVLLRDGSAVYFRPDLASSVALAPGQPFAASGIGTRSAAGLAIEAITVGANAAPAARKNQQ
ncbi:MAG: hypothetical protein ABW202_11835, partial [Duganella sp.]